MDIHSEDIINRKAKIVCPICKSRIRVDRFENHAKKAHKKYVLKPQVKLLESEEGSKIYYSKCRKCRRFVKSHKLREHLSLCLNGIPILPSMRVWKDLLPSSEGNKPISTPKPKVNPNKLWVCGEKISNRVERVKIIYTPLCTNRRRH